MLSWLYKTNLQQNITFLSNNLIAIKSTDGAIYEADIIKSNRRSISISIKPILTSNNNEQNIKIIIRFGRFNTQAQVLEFLEQKYQWIISSINKISQKQNLKKPYKTKNYQNNDIIFILNKQYNLSMKQTGLVPKKIKDRIICNWQNNSIICLVDSSLNTDKALNYFLKERAKKILTSRLDICFYNFKQAIINGLANCNNSSDVQDYLQNLPKPCLVVKFVRSKWGSLHFKFIKAKNKVLNLNLQLQNQAIQHFRIENLQFLTDTKITLATKLIAESTEHIDYIIMHELCHIIFQNHSKQFYELQQHFVPHYKTLSKTIGIK